MKVLFVNPHRSDFVYISPAYNFIKRKSLRKYKYLDIFFKENDTDFLFCKSSFFRVLKSLGIGILDFIFLKSESNIFKKINDIKKNRFLYKCIESYDLTFCFGFSIRDLNDLEFNNLAEKSKLIIIHLSHYHLYATKLKIWSKQKNVVFCADSNITETYFYNYYLDNKPQFFVLSFSIDKDKFKMINPIENRNNKIISTGTFHEFEKIYNISYLMKNDISSKFGFLTIHPERRVLFYLKHILDNIEILNSSMGGFSIFNFFKKNNTQNQSKYFSFDIVQKYNNHRYVFVGEESITGLPGIGVFEAILCGCIPIINDYSYRGTPLENSSVPIIYYNMNNLYNIMKNFNIKIFHNEYTEIDLQKMRIEVSNFYSESNQLELLKNFIKYN